MFFYPAEQHYSDWSSTSFHPGVKRFPLVTLGVWEAEPRFESGARKGFPNMLSQQASPLQTWVSTPLCLNFFFNENIIGPAVNLRWTLS